MDRRSQEDRPEITTVAPIINFNPENRNRPRKKGLHHRHCRFCRLKTNFGACSTGLGSVCSMFSLVGDYVLWCCNVTLNGCCLLTKPQSTCVLRIIAQAGRRHLGIWGKAYHLHKCNQGTYCRRTYPTTQPCCREDLLTPIISFLDIIPHVFNTFHLSISVLMLS